MVERGTGAGAWLVWCVMLALNFNPSRESRLTCPEGSHAPRGTSDTGRADCAIA